MVTRPPVSLRTPVPAAPDTRRLRRAGDVIATPSAIVRLLVGVIAVLAPLACLAGLVWQADGPSTFTTVRGETVELFGSGLYRYDSLFAGAGNQGTDVVTLALGLPLLVASAIWALRGSLRGSLLLMGALAWFVYVYASYALGAVAYNSLFLVYVALFAASLWALVLLIASVDSHRLAAHLPSAMPRRGPAIFLFASGAVTLGVWLMSPVSALVTGGTPDHLAHYSTLFTTAFDIAVIVPLTIVAGCLVLRRNPLGYLIAFPLLVLEVFLAPMIVAQTISQLSAGVAFTTGEIVGPIAGFTTIAVLAIVVGSILLRNMSDVPVSTERS